MNTQFNTIQTLSGFLGLIGMTIFVILFLKWILRRAVRKHARNRNNTGKWHGLLALRNKYPEADAFRYSGSLLRYGVMVALSASLLAFNWTIYEKPVYIPGGTPDTEDVIGQIPITTQLPKLIPPPPPTVVEPVAEDVVLDDSPEFESMDIYPDERISDFEEKEFLPPPPPPPPPPKVTGNSFFSIAEVMPRFPGCEDAAMSDKEKEECARMKMLEYIYKSLKYPALARETGVEGTVVIQFIVDREGRIEEVNIVRDIGAGCGEAAAKIVREMNELSGLWTPGRQRGRPVKVLYTLPVKFKLEG